MKWISNNYTKNIIKKFEHLIPEDFNFNDYINLHPDLLTVGINDEQKAKEHFLLFGRKENRIYKKSIISDTPITESKPELWNNGQNLLYFSPMAPDYDCSSGGNRLLQILSILKLDLKYNIWFLCNGYSSIKHIKILEDLNIPVYISDVNKQHYLNRYLEQAKQNNIEFHNVIFSWYDIAHQYMEMVKTIYPNIKIIVDTVDVHWVREQRGKDSGQLNIPQDSLDFRKTIEKNIYKQADTIFAITEKDKQHIQKEIGYGYNIKILSNIHDKHNIELGNNMMFVGNFNHGPNTDAALSCIEIYRLFQQTDIFQNLKIKPKLLIAGPHLDPEMQTKILQNHYIEYLGHLPDLHLLYQQSNLLVSPLNWGAGIKGKICDAGMCNIPILTSDIGNEGIGFIDKKNALIANNTQEFVKQLIYFYQLAPEEQLKIGLAGQQHLNTLVSKQAAINILKHTLQDRHIVISIVTYNQIEKLIKCLQKILNLTKYNNYIIHVSDNSDNDSIKNQILSLNSDKIIYQKNKINEYFIEPNNKIFLKKEYENSDFVLVNDDIEINDGNWLSYLYSSAYSADYISAVGGKTLYPDGRLAEAGAELYCDGRGRNIGRYQDPNSAEFNRTRYVGYCSGCLLYIRHDAIKKIGVFSTNLEKLYYEDSDWQYRSHAYGLKTVYDHRCSAIHHEGSTAGSDINIGAKRYQATNRQIFLYNMRTLGISNIEIFNNE